MHLVNKTVIAVSCRPENYPRLAVGCQGEMVSIIEGATDRTIEMEVLFPDSQYANAQKFHEKAKQLRSVSDEKRLSSTIDLAAKAEKLGARVYVYLPRNAVYSVAA